ncbi:class I mannose-6-phosphate isomerase [Flavobacterium agricola]|uniref:Phosphohexomutase n=1 Tax=Flavobacterium agricola TaxID=2870839 RepID=A0ABY6M2F0_9FLAO|nr:type I phosphomannose isomerase catalytic subunit [Flavobacterium agricola]UYW01585.1 class I mannose-6-phosphate isomerase [Flavobacterium agricola]
MSNNNILYPLLFKPIYKERIWGGCKLKTYLGKDIPSDSIGESWEIADLPNDTNLIANGNLKGTCFKTAINQYKDAILGGKVVEKFGLNFPLLFKFLDAKDDLSIQLHPNDELAKKRHNSFGKTEMWYVMQADEDAEIIIGFKENCSSSQYLKHLENKTLPQILKRIKVKAGDVYFLETGTIHAIGKGIVIAEVQQTSDITYRVYDWDRVDAKGKSRELCRIAVELALDAINYNYVDAKRVYTSRPNQNNPIVSSNYFTTNFIPLTAELSIVKNSDCFRVYIVTQGLVNIQIENEIFSFQLGDTILIPASITNYVLKGQADLLEIYIEY